MLSAVCRAVFVTVIGKLNECSVKRVFQKSFSKHEHSNSSLRTFKKYSPEDLCRSLTAPMTGSSASVPVHADSK
jgi:hypothetical protein